MKSKKEKEQQWPVQGQPGGNLGPDQGKQVDADISPQLSMAVAGKTPRFRREQRNHWRKERLLMRLEGMSGPPKFAVWKRSVENYFQNSGYYALDMVHDLSFLILSSVWKADIIFTLYR